MRDVGVQRLRPGHRQDDGPQGDEGRAGMPDDERNRLGGGEGDEDVGMPQDVRQPHEGEQEEPREHDRAEDPAHFRGPVALCDEEHGQNHQGDGDDEAFHAREGDFQAFHGREHGDRGGDDGVAEEQSRSEDAEKRHEHGDSAGREAAAHPGRQGEDAAFAVVVGSQHEAYVFDGDDEDEHPDDAGDDAGDVLSVERDRPAVQHEDGAQHVQGAGADVAEDHSEGREPERHRSGLLRSAVPAQRGFRIHARYPTPAWASVQLGGVPVRR